MPPAEDGRGKQRDGAWVSDVLSLSYYTKLPKRERASIYPNSATATLIFVTAATSINLTR